jgi:hypothetical protein
MKYLIRINRDDIRLKLTRRNPELVNLRNGYVIGRGKSS